MVVECEECQAKFKVDDSKIPEKGIKARCSKCKHLFLVKRPAPPVEDLALKIEDQQESPEVDVSPEPPVEEPAVDTQGQEESLGVDEGPSPPEEEPALDEGSKEEEDFQIDDGEAESFAADMGTTGTGEPEGEIEESFESTIKIDLSDQQEMPFDEEEAFPEEKDAKEVPKKKGIGTPILIALIGLIVVVLIAAAYFFILPTFLGPPETPTSNLTVTDLNGHFEQNVQIPKTFVIEGKIINESKKARRFIQVKGILFNNQGKPVKKQLAYCGNQISKKDLKTKSPKFIQKAMNNKSGSRGENNLVKPGASIPFTIVFFYLPKEMAEYSAEVVNSQIVE